MMKNPGFYTLAFSMTLFVAAALLFSVQPMFSKMILPLLGGSPQVWTTAMLVFQFLLLAGYSYAHLTARWLDMRAQATLHAAILGVMFLILPFGIPAGAAPPVEGSPALWQIKTMILTVGGPFFALSATAPMLQGWFARADHADAEDPYFLYGASNFGSLVGLFAFPLVLEPALRLSEQAALWRWLYAVLIALIVLSAALAGARSKARARRKAARPAEKITWTRRALWLALAFIPSSLMLGVTTYITSDIAAVPLLWIVPLALYVGSFILAFAKRKFITLKDARNLAAMLTMGMLIQNILGMTANAYMVMLVHFSLFFAVALFCHMELAATRPDSRRLTEFYLILSLGGVLGGIFNALIAPNFFLIPLEYALALAAGPFLRYAASDRQSLRAYVREARKQGLDFIWAPETVLGLALLILGLLIVKSPSAHGLRYFCAFVAFAGLALQAHKRWAFGTIAAMLLLLFPPGYEWGGALKKIIYRDRNFFGIIRVAETNGFRIFAHGVTTHGAQSLNPENRLEPLTYYNRMGPIADAFRYFDARPGPQRIGALGLGVGSIACYAHKSRHFDFFEIDPAVRKVATNPKLFTYLSDCGSPYDIIMGDGRLGIAREPDSYYDLILLDAFTSDNIPAHLLTVEALRLYLSKLKADGVLLVHISNRFLDLEPVLARAAETIGVKALCRLSYLEDPDLKKKNYQSSHVCALSRSQPAQTYLARHGWTAAMARAGVSAWTDQFSNIVTVLGPQTLIKRAQAAKAALEKEALPKP